MGVSTNPNGAEIQLYNEAELQGISFDYNKSDVYLFYPIVKQMVISFGENTKNRLGYSGSSPDIMKLCPSTKGLDPIAVESSYWHSVIVDKDKDLWRTGYVRSIGSEFSEY